MAATAIVVGAGIVGLATARALAVRGYQVTVVDRNARALGASIRNFGMVWPIGQPDGYLYERAMLSRRIWKEVCNEAGIWYDKKGSLHLAYEADEWQVIREMASMYQHRNYLLLDGSHCKAASSAIVPEGLHGGLFSPDEMIVDPREALAKMPVWLAEKWGVKFCWGRAITDISYPYVYAGYEQWEADRIYVCSGADFETLYPTQFREAAITKCKLQMMRTAPQPKKWRMGPSLCGGLSLLHYKGFAGAQSLTALRARIESEMPEYLQWGIHVMVSQNQEGALTIGDSHEYGWSPDPFDKDIINRKILSYLRGFARFEDERIVETWHGVYAKMTNGNTEFVLHPEQGVTIINALGGAGMTLSFGLCEQTVGGNNL